MILTRQKKPHYDLEIDTAALVKDCYHTKCLGNSLTPSKLYALCQLTWHDRLPRTREQRKWKALWVIGDNKGEYPNIESADEFGKCGFSPESIVLAKNDTGFVGLYAAFRNSSYDWIVKHFDSLAPLVHKVAWLESDVAARKIFEQIEKLDGIPRPNSKGGKLKPASLLTPLFACLDPRLRFPIINKNDAVIKLHKRLGITYASLPDKFDVLIREMKRSRIGNALMLDVCNSDVVGSRIPSKRATKKRILNVKSEDDVSILLKQRTIKIRHLHNKMTNGLRELCKSEGLEIGQQFYDALISNYDKGCDLLIEAKSSMDRASLRLAVGQLLDYRRSLARGAVTDLAVLLPRKPEKDAISYLSDIGIYAIWFTDANFKKLNSNLAAFTM